MLCRAIHSIGARGQFYAPGSVLELPDEEASRLSEAGAVELVAGEEPQIPVESLAKPDLAESSESISGEPADAGNEPDLTEVEPEPVTAEPARQPEPRKGRGRN